MATLQHSFTYRDALAASEKVNWRVEDLIGGGRELDFSRPFLPDSLARVGRLGFLSPEQRLALNQIRGHGYLYTFGLVEEFILPFVLDHARPQLREDDDRVRALLQFATEEAKHIHLFKRFREEFQQGFGHACEVIGPPEAIAEAALAHQPLAVALTTLHIEWMTQRHYTDSVKDDGNLDPQFKSLLKHHWMEEAQHARLDVLMIEALGAALDEEAILGAVEEYLEIGGMLDEGLQQQARLDIESLERTTGTKLSEAERDEVFVVQRQALRWTFLGSGMTHPSFVKTLGELSPRGLERVRDVSPAFC